MKRMHAAASMSKHVNIDEAAVLPDTASGCERVLSSPPRISTKRALFLIGGCCWLLFAVGFALLLKVYLTQGAGLQFFGWSFSSGSVLIGTVHVAGLILASLISFAVGAYFWARAFVRTDGKKGN